MHNAHKQWHSHGTSCQQMTDATTEENFSPTTTTEQTTSNHLHQPNTMNITISIPSLDRLCSILEKGIDINQLTTGIHTLLDPAPTPKKKEKVTPPAPVDPPAPITSIITPEITLEDEDEEEETPTLVVKAPTVESITNLAKSFIAFNSPAALRDLLDGAGIAGQKISTCDKSFYPAIEMALTTALEMVK